MRKGALLVMALLFGVALFGQKTAWELSVQKQFDEAVGLYNKRLYNPARTKFEEVLASDVPIHTRWAEESSFYRAMCALFLFNKDAEALLEDFSLTYPASPLEPKAALTAAEYYFNKRNYRKALEWYNRADRKSIKGDEARSEYYFKLGYSQYMNKEFDQAKLSFLEVKDKEGVYGPSAKYYYAHMAYTDSNYVTALENFMPLLEDESFGPVVPYYLAQIYYKRKDYDALIEYAEPLLAKATEKRKPEISKLLGEAYLKKENYTGAIPAFEFYRDNGGRMRTVDHYSLGYAYYKTEKYSEAIGSFNKITASKGDLAQNAYYHLGDCYLKTGNKSLALSAFKAATEMGSNAKIKEDAFFNYAKLNYELANPYGSAIDAFQGFLEAYPTSVKKADANKYLANLYLTTKDYENALQALSNTGLATKDMREAYQKVSYFRGVQLYNATQLENARTYFNHSLTYPINPTYVALAHFWRAESFYKEEDFQEALKEITLFENTSGSYALSEFAEARYSKAYCYFMLDNYANAITSFRLYLENKSAVPRKKQDAELRLGDAYFMQRNYATAIKFYNSYLAYNPNDADYALFQKALCQGLSGKGEEKVATLQKLVSSYPQSRYAVDGKYEQGATLLAMDKNQQALSIFQDFVTEYPQSKHTRRAWLNIGLIYRNTDQYEKSIDVFKRIVADYPATPEANEAIGFARLVYARLNRVDEYVDWVENISFADIKRASLDSNMYSTAFDFYSLNDCKEAIKAFNSYLTKFPDGFFQVQSNYYLGECAYKDHQDDLAEQALQRVVNESRSEYTERSIAMLASINYAKPDYERALTYYEKLLDFSEEIDQLRKARVGAMRCAVELDIPSKSLQYAELIWQDERSEPELVSEALLVRARSYWKTQDIEKAHQAYEDVKRKSKGAPQAEAAYFIAKIQNRRGEYVKSNETIFWMIDNLPSYQSWRFKSLLVMADNYYQTDDVFQANYTLDFIIDADFDADIVAEAKRMKEEIRRAEESEDAEMQRKKEELNETIIEIEEGEVEELPEEGSEEQTEGEVKK